MDHQTDLKVDNRFKSLITPLQKQEYRQLEENILEDGCRDPIIVWDGVIVDGHNRYEICKEHGIPFSVKEKYFSCFDEAVAWICANQLGRRNISDETRKYLIGKQYEAEKHISYNRNPQGNNQHSAVASVSSTDSKQGGHVGRTNERIAKENNISRGTVEKYAIYTRAIEAIEEKNPGFTPDILSGKYKVSHDNVVELSKLSPPEIRKVERRIKRMQEPYVRYKNTREIIQSPLRQGADKPVPSVKDMPEFDPDAEVTGLALTIPSWVSSIERVQMKTDLTIISHAARQKIIKELNGLIARAMEMLETVEEVSC